MDKIVIDKIVAAMDKVMDDFKKNEESIFPDDNTRTILKYENAKQIFAWNKSNVCIFKGCKEKSIIGSHSIQKSSSLKLIAENNHVIAIKFDRVREKLAATKVGTNIASTFPGFCKKHEDLFSHFETRKELVKSHDFYLQVYRTVCREIVNKNRNINILEERKRQYLTFRNKKLGEHLANVLGSEFISEHKINADAFKFEYCDHRIRQIDEKIKTLKKDIKGFLYKFHAGILSDIQVEKSNKIYVNVLEIDIEVPVCLAGRGNFALSHNSRIKNIDVILNVLPFPNKTFIVASVLSKYKNELDLYINRFSNPLEAVNMIESWMVHGSEHWFIKPSVWDKIQTKFKKEIVEDIWDLSKNIGDKYKYSILNDIKRIFLDIASKSDKENIPSMIQKILNEERKKLTD